ncbi:transglutaminase-like domain-containing protein [Methylobacterium sp. E-025]|uniref:transglutaminase-like domain-containing protein n=1 Tax=Methylobacterium sp. E-025 TaxID=2836561 RepID=UPI00391A3C40
MVDYAHVRLRFDYNQADTTRSAFDGYGEQVGVCRDFAHLSVTLCRCMNIPACYVMSYLSDIGLRKRPGADGLTRMVRGPPRRSDGAMLVCVRRSAQSASDRPHRDGLWSRRDGLLDHDHFRTRPACGLHGDHRRGRRRRVRPGRLLTGR